MHNSRLLHIIKSFSQEELNSFHDFLHSDTIKDKNPKELLKLFDLFQKYYPKLDDNNLSKENAYLFIYQEPTMVQGKFDKLLTRFLKVTYQFICSFYYKELCNPQVIICTFLQKRNLEPAFNREFKKWNKSLDGQKFYDSGIMYERFLLKELLVIDQTQKGDPKIILELPELLQNLDQYYFFTKITYACQLLAINLFMTPVDTKDSLESFKYLEKLIGLPHLQLPVIQVYYQAYKMLASEAEFKTENVDKFKALLVQFDKQLSTTQKIPLNAFIRNYAIFQYHNGEKAFLKYVFDIYKDHLGRGYLYEKNKLLAQTFINIVTSGLRFGEYDWVYKFLNEYRYKILGTEPPGAIFNYNMSLYLFYIKEYQKALDILPDNFNNIYFKIGAKRLELILYYETELEILDSKIEAYKVFTYRISKSEITEIQKTANKNFIHLLKQIRHPKTEVNRERINNLISKINDLNFIAEKEWLIEILERMKF